MFARTVTVRPSDVSSDGKIKLRSLLDYFQDTAGMAVEGIEGTATELYSRGYAWVLMKYEIDFTAPLPGLDDTFTLHTFHDPNHGYNTLRMFRTDFVSAKTSWLLADVHTGRPVKPAAHIPGITSRDNQDISPDFRDIPEIRNITASHKLPVRFHDLDYNGHVNHAAYFQHVYDLSLSDSVPRRLKSLCASFRSGAKPGEVMTLDFEDDGGISLCRVSRPNVSKPCAFFMCEWGNGNAE